MIIIVAHWSNRTINLWLEKRHKQVKTEYNVMLALFKNVEITDAFLMWVNNIFSPCTLSQWSYRHLLRGYRNQCGKRNISSIHVYPEGMECSSSTAYRILSSSDNVMLIHILINGTDNKKIHTERTRMQKRILWFLDITEKPFWRNQ